VLELLYDNRIFPAFSCSLKEIVTSVCFSLRAFDEEGRGFIELGSWSW